MDFRKTGWAIALLFPICLAGCHGLHRTPAWVANPKSVYPEDRFLVCVGEGDTRRAAENAAAANLSRIFEAHIESDERLLDKTRESGKQFVRTTDFTSDVNILSAQTLYNIQHAEAWKDNNGRYHAVAYLNRRETARIYLDKIEEQTARVEFLLDQARQTDGLLKKYALLRTANRHSLENEILLQQLKVIHPPSATAPSYSANDFRKTLANSAKQIRVRIVIDGDENGRMAACLEELITRYGFVVGTPAELDIEGRVAVKDTGERTAGLVFVRYELAMQIKDSTETIILSLSNQGRESHFTPEGARTRSFRTLENAINAGGAQRLDAYFESLVE